MTGAHNELTEASAWVKRFAAAIPQQGLVLDLACGSGRNSLCLASSGYRVLAVDRDTASLDSLKIPLIQTEVLDLEGEVWPLVNHQFAGIVVTNYLYRPYLDLLPEMLLDGGVLIYETFALGNSEFGKPSNPNFLLNPGELLALAQGHGLKVLAYEDIYVDHPKPAMIQRICAVKGGLKGRIPLQFAG
jgi:SAM-dependent methyltransferase